MIRVCRPTAFYGTQKLRYLDRIYPPLLRDLTPNSEPNVLHISAGSLQQSRRALNLLSEDVIHSR